MELVCVEREEGSGGAWLGCSDVSSAGASAAFRTPWLVKWLCTRKQSVWSPCHMRVVWGANQNFTRRSTCLLSRIKIN